MRAIGLMSGTSMDGIDVALIETDGETVSRFGPSALHFYQEHEVAILRRAMEAAPALRARTERPGVIAEAEKISTALHASAVNTFLTVNGIDRASIDVIGFHGQTVLHRPEREADRAARRRRRARARDRHSGRLRFPRRRCRGGRAGRAAGSGAIIARWRARSTGRIRSRCSISAASPTSRSSMARTIRSPATPARRMP